MAIYSRPKRREELPADIPYSDDLSVLKTPQRFGTLTAPNRIVYQPMEGCDGTPNGSPGELTERRYLRFAKGGPGVIWLEATAVVPEGRANPRQLWLNPESVDAFAKLVETIRGTCLRENGYEPVVICQLTHSGRHSKPHGYPEPLIAVNKKIFEADGPLPADRILSDDALAALPERFAVAAKLAERAGFDGVDVKCCHGYLFEELLSAYERTGRYGGDLNGRTRLLRETVEAVRSEVGGGMLAASRFNAYDGYARPFGFGDSGVSGKPDYTEAKQLARCLAELGVGLFDITMGNPYYNNEVNRPTVFAEHDAPTDSAVRMISGAAEIAKAVPEVPVVSSGWTYFGAFAPQMAAGAITSGMCSMVGFGRQTFCYPELARDILREGVMKPDCLCLTCGKCTQLMRAGGTPGCVVFDREVYLKLYRERVENK